MSREFNIKNKMHKFRLNFINRNKNHLSLHIFFQWEKVYLYGWNWKDSGIDKDVNGVLDIFDFSHSYRQGRPTTFQGQK